MARHPVYRFPVRFAGLELDAIGFDSERGRDVAEWRPNRGDGSQLSDRGRRARRDRLTVQIVDDRPGDLAADRRVALQALASSGEARLFSHPLDGQWFARLVGMQNNLADGKDVWTLELVEDTPASRAHAAQLDEPASRESVEVAADAYDAAAAAVQGATLPSSSGARELVGAWDTRAPDVDDHAAQLQATTSALHEGLRPLETDPALDAWRAWLAGQELIGELERFAIAVRAVADRTFSFELMQPRPLLPLCAHLYGAANARARFEQVVVLNRVKNPLRVPAGTVLRMPVAA